MQSSDVIIVAFDVTAGSPVVAGGCWVTGSIPQQLLGVLPCFFLCFFTAGLPVHLALVMSSAEFPRFGSSPVTSSKKRSSAAPAKTASLKQLSRDLPTVSGEWQLRVHSVQVLNSVLLCACCWLFTACCWLSRRLCCTTCVTQPTSVDNIFVFYLRAWQLAKGPRKLLALGDGSRMPVLTCPFAFVVP